jgi:hypothetical protein
VQLRRQIFRQIVGKAQAILCVLTSIFGRYDGKDASKCATKALAANCAVLPLVGKLLSSLCPAARKNLATVSVGHPFAEAVFHLAMALLGLVRSFHPRVLL